MSIQKFNIRVYGILINSETQVLITDELIKGQSITKFPGGGLELGEGLIEGLKREFMEETGNQVEVIKHFYTTDYFQISAYDPSHQIISVYYLVKPISELRINTKQKVVDFDKYNVSKQTFRWVDIKNISADDFTFPIDKIVGEMLQKHKNKLV